MEHDDEVDIIVPPVIERRYFSPYAVHNDRTDVVILCVVLYTTLTTVWIYTWVDGTVSCNGVLCYLKVWWRHGQVLKWWIAFDEDWRRRFRGLYELATMYDPSISLEVLLALWKSLASFGYVLCTEFSVCGPIGLFGKSVWYNYIHKVPRRYARQPSARVSQTLRPSYLSHVMEAVT